MMMRAGAGFAHKYDFRALRFLGSVGGPLNPEAVVWGQEALGRPFHDNWWQTETGGIMIDWDLTGYLPAASSPTKVASDGEYVYLLGDDGGAWWYAPVGTGGTLAPWQATTSISGYGPPNYRRCGVAIDGGRIFYAEANYAGKDVIVHTARTQSDGSLGPWGTAATISATTAWLYCPEPVALGGFLCLLTSNSDASFTGASWAAIQEDGTLQPITGTAQTNYYRDGARMVGAAGYLYAVGGYDSGKGQSEVSVERIAIDPQSGALGPWQVVDASLPDRFDLGASAVYGGKLYLAGGLSGLGGYYGGRFTSGPRPLPLWTPWRSRCPNRRPQSGPCLLPPQYPGSKLRRWKQPGQIGFLWD